MKIFEQPFNSQDGIRQCNNDGVGFNYLFSGFGETKCSGISTAVRDTRYIVPVNTTAAAVQRERWRGRYMIMAAAVFCCRTAAAQRHLHIRYLVYTYDSCIYTSSS